MRTPFWAASVTAAMARLSLAWRESAGFSGSGGAFRPRLEPPHCQGCLDGPGEVRDLERLSDVVVSAEGERSLQDVLVRLSMELEIDGAGDHEHPDARVEGMDPLERLDPTEPRHHEVEHHGVGAVPLDVQQGLEPVRRFEHVEAGHPEGLDEYLPDVLVVIRNQYSHEEPLRGRRSRPVLMLTSRTRRGP